MLALDRAIFAGQGRFIGISATNHGVAVGEDVDSAHRLLDRSEVATVAGPLHPQVAAADVDPADTGADPEAGEAAAEELISWCEAHGLAWLLRASGRPGGHHVLALVPPDLTGQWRGLCARLGRHHGVALQPRRTLRLVTAAHRHGLPAPVLAGTLTAADIPAPEYRTTPPTGGRRRPRRARGAGRRAGQDRSRTEYGDALARARAGWGPGRAFAAANLPDSKAAEFGELEWRRWVWSRAVTVVCAEQQLDEDQAWLRFQRASPARARQLGRDGWHEAYWLPAVAEAGQERPRRARVDRAAAPLRPADEHAAEQREIEQVRAALRSVAEQQVALTGRRPQFARSAAAVLDAVAAAIVRRDGSISERAWCEQACVARSTLRRVVDWACERGILYRARTYTGGTEDSAAWRTGPDVTAEIERLGKTDTTRWYTPTAPTHGHADRTRLRQRHAKERRAWSLRCTLSAHTEATGEIYKSSQHPAATALRSLWHQRRRWQSLTSDQQEHRRNQRRAQLGRMHRTERRAWLDWLARREHLTAAAERTEHGHVTATDHAALAAAPRTVHLGLRDPTWRTGGRPSTSAAPAAPVAVPDADRTLLAA